MEQAAAEEEVAASASGSAFMSSPISVDEQFVPRGDSVPEGLSEIRPESGAAPSGAMSDGGARWKVVWNDMM